jgi:imidazolonepropionase-like amidohydrolase
MSRDAFIIISNHHSNWGITTMARSQRASLGSRSLAVGIGVVCVVAASLPAALRTVTADDQSSLGAGVYPAAYAITGARVVAAPGKTYEPGTIVVRRGVIEAVGLAKDVAAPYDAETIDGKGLVVYPGFIDLHTAVGQRAGAERSATGKGRPVDLAEAPLCSTPPDNRRGLTPEFQVAGALELGDSVAEPRRRLGFTDLVSAPAGAIATGQSALVSLSGLPRRETIVAAPVALHVNLAPPFEGGAGPAAPGQPAPAPTPGLPPAVTLTPGPGPTPTPGQPPARRRGLFGQEGPGENPYPRVLVGSIAHFRQAMLDADHLRKVEAYYEAHDGGQPPYDPALQALVAARSKKLPVWWDANSRDEIHRALDLAEEFGTTAVIVGGREAAKVADRLKASNIPVVLSLRFPEEPRVPSQEDYRKRPPAERTEPLRVLADRKAKWKEQVGTATALAKAGVLFAFSTEGIERIDTLPAIIRQLIANGLTADQALAGLTKNAAAIAGVGRRLGALEPGKLGHVIAVTAAFTEERARVRYVLVDGLKFEIKPEERARTKGGRPGGDGFGGGFDMDFPPPASSGTSSAPGSTKKAAAGETKKAEARRDAPDSNVKAASPGSPGARPSSPEGTSPEGKPAPAKSAEVGRMLTKAEAPARPQAKSAAATQAPKVSAAPEAKPASAKGQEPKAQTAAAEKEKAKTAPFVDVASELEEDRKPAIHTGGSVLIKDASILTVTKGTIVRGSILVEDGKIKAVGTDVQAPAGIKVIEAAGLVAMPGIIDTHSHIAVSGGVNEGSLSIVPEVRIKDVVTGDDPSIYRALAGGTTTARLLHGSANTIGGQDAVIKLRHGKPGRELIIQNAPQGVKFALGENVTRSRGRFPNTRMGVESVIERAFDEARAYRRLWADYRKAAESKGRDRAGVPPRTDLRLEALAAILDGSIRIHSHCYRSDEILMLLGTAQRYGVRVQSLQHVLEGYKVAAEIAAHGASASTFSDWWAYKIEAYDAIPYNAALLTEAGASVCIKSDDAELMRHLNLEAAKMVKYGGVTEAQALAMITINPARELGIDDRVGSIELGKDADIVLFNGHPFDAFARCELALIDGEVFFHRREADGKFGIRPGANLAMPIAPEPARTRIVDIAAQPKDVFALVGATLHPVSGADVKGGTLVISGGKIAALGPPGTAIPAEAQTIDLSGLDIWPGMIDAGSTLGLFEVGSLSETQDYADSAQFQPELRASVALHPDSEHIPVTRASGVLTAFVGPTGGTISGQSCLIDLNGWVPRELVIADCLALNVTIPTYIAETPQGQRPGFGRFGPGGGAAASEARQRRKERLERIAEAFKKAIAYDDVVTSARKRGDSPPTPDPRLEALVPYARGQKPVIFHAEQQVEILDAIEIARAQKLKAVISGGSEAWKVAAAIKEAKIPVLVAGTLRLPRHDYDPYDGEYSNPAKLHAAGVSVAIRAQGGGAGSATSGRNLPYEAATAAAFGLPEDAAIKSVTLVPAQILGVADQVGSLEAGKRANLVVTAGHLLQPTTIVHALFIDGRPVAPESRHTQLYAKYRRRLDEVRAGRARLGIDRPATALSGHPETSPAATSASPKGN